MIKNIFKSVSSVIAGMMVIIILSVVTDMVLEKVGFFPPQSQGAYASNLLAIALFYRTLYAVAGGYVTAKLAPSKSMKHVIVLLVIGTVLGILGAVAGWNLSQHWYPIALVLTSAIGVWLGGKLEVKQKMV